MEGFEAVREEIRDNMLKTVDRHLRFGGRDKSAIARMILRSLSAAKCGSNPLHAPIYKVCVWLDSHDVKRYTSLHTLCKTISEATGVNTVSIYSMFKTSKRLRIPGHLVKKRLSIVRQPSEQTVAEPEVPKKTKPEAHDKIEHKPKALEVPRERKASLDLPPTIKELTLKANGIELILKF